MSRINLENRDCMLFWCKREEDGKKGCILRNSLREIVSEGRKVFHIYSCADDGQFELECELDSFFARIEVHGRRKSATELNVQSIWMSCECLIEILRRLGLVLREECER